MLTSLHLSNFKCFRRADFSLGGLTLLTGGNGTGKSTVIQALLVARQSGTSGRLEPNGELIQLGRAKDVFNDQAEDEVMSLGLGGAEAQLNWRVQFLIGESDFVQLESPSSITSDWSLFTDDFHYLSAERWGPRVSVPLSDDQARRHQLGKYGQYAIQFLVAHGESRIPNDDVKAHKSAPRSRTLLQQTQAWLGELCPGVRIETRAITDADIGLASFSFAAGDEAVSSSYRPTNVAFGLSYTLPVVVALLSLPKGGIAILENPEAHLHPRAQTRLGKLIAAAAAAGIQTVVETHSDHVFNGIRLAVKEGDLSANDTRIYYFARHADGVKIAEPALEQSGKIDSWPEGFFDESAYNLASLAQP